MSEGDSTPAAATDDDQVLLERLAKREERRQKRMKEAMERQKENDVSETNGTENESGLQQTDKEEEDQPAGKEEADVNSCRTPDEDTEGGKKVKKNEFPILSVLFKDGVYLYFIYLYFIFHLPQQESAGESKTSTTAQVHLLFQIFCSFINKYINSALSHRMTLNHL